MNNKIDFIITWVDGNDEKWLEEKNKYKTITGSDNAVSRYRDWEILQYWFRGVEKYASWVNKIFFVTHGHLPKWLNTSNEKLVIVNHKDYIPNEYLPTFNSHTIEFNFHKIPNLSENFVYFNDDMFILKDVKEEDFFVNNLPCDSAVLSPIFALDRSGFSKIIVNNMAIINDRFNKKEVIKRDFSKWFTLKYGKDFVKNVALNSWDKFAGFNDMHIPISYNKESFETVWKEEEKAITDTCSYKFRNVNENISHWVIRYWQLCTGKFYPRSTKFGKYLEYSKDNQYIYDWITNQKSKVVCINDVEADYDFEVEKENLKKAFEKILPNKSSFEI